ncbi:MAG: GGDEF domain-containing protein [Bacillota bacterium]
MNTIKNIMHKIKYYLLIDRVPEPDLTRVNIQRFIIFFNILFAAHLLHIVLFWLALVNDGAQLTEQVYQWRLAIITAHSIMAVMALAAIFLTNYIRKNKLHHRKTGIYLPVVAAFVYLIFGAAICIVDQLVTPAITPYLIANVAVALGVILKPQISLVIYPLAYLVFYTFLPITQTDSEILLSIRVNGITATGIGLALSLIIWRTSMISLLQNKLIQTQKEALEKKNAELQKMARTDMLTGLNNRMRFTEYVEMETSRLKRTGGQSCLIFMDLDYFKIVNDTYGHPSGDTVLKWLAGIIKSQIRSTDILARFGGEEFAIMLPNTSVEGTLKVAEKIRSAIESCSFPGKMESLKMTASFGVAPLSSGENDSFKTAYKKADTALYRAKQGGRNQIEYEN